MPKKSSIPFYEWQNRVAGSNSKKEKIKNNTEQKQFTTNNKQQKFLDEIYSEDEDANLFLNSIGSLTKNEENLLDNSLNNILSEKLKLNLSNNTNMNKPKDKTNSTEPNKAFTNDYSKENELYLNELTPTTNNTDNLFLKAMDGVKPIESRGRDVLPKSKKDKKKILPQQSIEDLLLNSLEFALHYSEEYMEGSVVGIDPLVLQKLKSGNYSPEAHIDLHGLNASQAYDALIYFIKNSYQKNIRTVTVITGKGKNSPEGVPVIRTFLQDWLTKDPFKRVVLAFCTAMPRDGGTGAVYVLLRKFKKSSGKIRWERNIGFDDSLTYF